MTQRVPEKAQPVFDAFWEERKTLTSPGVALPFEDAFNLFMQSTRAYDAGAFELASLGCRAALESACYVFLTSYRLMDGGWRGQAPRNLDGTLRRVGFTEILQGIKTSKVLTAMQMRELAAIKDHGDLIAHFSAKNDRRLEAVSKKILARGVMGLEGAVEFEKGLAPLEILSDLKSGARILLAVAREWNSRPG